MVAAAERQIKNIHAVLDRGINRVEDVLAASVSARRPGEDVVVPQPGARRYPGHVIDTHAVDDSSLASHAGGDAGGVGPVILNRLRVEALLLRLIDRKLWQQ